MPEGQPEAMTRHWHQSGKTVDGGPGLPWHVSLYVPLVVLMLIKGFDSRQMKAYLAENVVARVSCGALVGSPDVSGRKFTVFRTAIDFACLAHHGEQKGCPHQN